MASVLTVEPMSAWSEALKPLFGAHQLQEVSPVGVQQEAPREIVTAQRGLLRLWKVRHGPQRIVVLGVKNFRKDVMARLKTGCFLLLVVDEGDAIIEHHAGASTLRTGDALLLTAIEPFTFTAPRRFAATWVEVPIWWLLELCRGVMGARRRLDGALGTTAILRTALKGVLAEAVEGPQTDNMVDVFGDVLARNLQISNAGDRRDGQVDRIHRYISANYRTEGLSPRDAAKALGCSLSSIHKSCASMGFTFGGLLSTMRLSVAAYMLSRTETSISVVAFDCGFSSLSHFCHAFKAHYGVTAGSVRRRHRATDQGTGQR